jgi:hypothetical protein
MTRRAVATILRTVLPPMMAAGTGNLRLTRVATALPAIHIARPSDGAAGIVAGQGSAVASAPVLAVDLCGLIGGRCATCMPIAQQPKHRTEGDQGDGHQKQNVPGRQSSDPEGQKADTKEHHEDRGRRRVLETTSSEGHARQARCHLTCDQAAPTDHDPVRAASGE